MSSGPSQECLKGICSGTSLRRSFCANVAENKVCAVVGTTATARQTWEPAVCEVQCSSGNTHWREDKFHTLHNFPPPPCRGISKPACQKEEPVVEILPDLTLLHKAYLDGKEGGENRTVVNGSLGRPSSQPDFVSSQQHFPFSISHLFNIISMSSLTSGSQFSLMVRLAEVWSNWICMIPT